MVPGLNEILYKLQATIIQLFFLITAANNISYTTPELVFLQSYKPSL